MQSFQAKGVKIAFSQANLIAYGGTVRYKVRLNFDSTETEKSNVQSLSGYR